MRKTEWLAHLFPKAGSRVRAAGTDVRFLHQAGCGPALCLQLTTPGRRVRTESLVSRIRPSSYRRSHVAGARPSNGSSKSRILGSRTNAMTDYLATARWRRSRAPPGPANPSRGSGITSIRGLQRVNRCRLRWWKPSKDRCGARAKGYPSGCSACCSSCLRNRARAHRGGRTHRS